MKKFMKNLTCALLIASALAANSVFAEEAEPVEEVIVGVNPQAYAIDAYQLLESSLQFAYNGYPDHYAGCWLEDDILCVGITTADEGVRSIYLDILAPAKCKIEYRVVKYSYNQLMNFNEIIWSGYAVDPLAEAVTMAELYGMNSSGILTDRNCVEVTSMQGYSEEFYAALVSFAESIGADEDIFVLDESAHAIVPATEESVIEESPAQSPNLAVELPVGLSSNPLRDYFSQTYGENVYPNHYAGCWHESTAVLPSSSDADEFGEVSMEMSGGLVLHIMLAEEVDEETLAHYSELCMADAAFISDLDFSVVFDHAEYSYNTLRYIKDEAAARYEARVGTEKYLQATIDENDNRVILRCEEYDDALHAVVDELTEEFGKSGALFEVKVVEAEIVIAEPQTGPGEVLPIIEEVVVEEIFSQSVSVDENPLLPYFSENYGTAPDWYAGVWLDGSGTLHIALTPDTDEDIRNECRAVCGDSVIFETAAYSLSQLEAYRDEALRRGREMHMLMSGGIDESMNKAELYVIPSHGENIPAELTDMLDSLAEEMGLDRDVYILAVTLEPDEPAEEIVIEEPIEENLSDLVTKVSGFYPNPLEEYFFSEYGDGVYPDDYAGCWFSNRFDMHIMLTENVTEENRLKYMDIASLSHIGVISTETVVFSMNDLNRALTELKYRFGDGYCIGKVHGIINEAENRIDLTVNYLNDEREAILESIASDIGKAEWYRLFAAYVPVSGGIEESAEESPEIISYPAAQPQTSPATYDTATLLCLLFSSLSAAGIIIEKHTR